MILEKLQKKLVERGACGVFQVKIDYQRKMLNEMVIDFDRSDPGLIVIVVVANTSNGTSRRVSIYEYE